uniref:Uncharacterized protein n=1 Tax=Magallana gigas TaxID=29159 RepID=K1R9W2_MAGGI
MESMFLYRDCNDNFNFHPKYSIDNNLLTFVYIMTILPPVMCSTHSFVNGINQYVVMTVVMYLASSQLGQTAYSQIPYQGGAMFQGLQIDPDQAGGDEQLQANLQAAYASQSSQTLENVRMKMLKCRILDR